jgi:hypothetical protein
MRLQYLSLLLILASHAFAQYQPHAIWQREGAGDSSLYGSQILALGDQNNDGYNDWAVYASGLGYAPAGSPNQPKVEFFHGGNPPDDIPYMTRVAIPGVEVAVRGAKALGDLNGDGYVDWAIFTSYVGDTSSRHIYKVYFGGPGPHDQPDIVLTCTDVWPIGDFNGDHYDDLLCSWLSGYGAAILYGGSSIDTRSSAENPSVIESFLG